MNLSLLLYAQRLSRHAVTAVTLRLLHVILPRSWNWYGAGALSAGPSLYQQIRSSGDFTLQPTKLLTSEYAEWNKLLNKQQSRSAVGQVGSHVKFSTATNTFAVINAVHIASATVSNPTLLQHSDEQCAITDVWVRLSLYLPLRPVYSHGQLYAGLSRTGSADCCWPYKSIRAEELGKAPTDDSV